VRLAQIAPDGTRYTEVAAVDWSRGKDVQRPAYRRRQAGNVWIVWAQNLQLGTGTSIARRYRNGELGATAAPDDGCGGQTSPGVDAG